MRGPDTTVLPSAPAKDRVLPLQRIICRFYHRNFTHTIHLPQGHLRADLRSNALYNRFRLDVCAVLVPPSGVNNLQHVELSYSTIEAKSRDIEMSNSKLAMIASLNPVFTLDRQFCSEPPNA